MSELEQLLEKADAIVDTYGAKGWSIDGLLELRRDLAGISWRLAAMSKDVFARAGMGYLGRKYAIASAIVNAREMDTSKRPPAMNVLEVKASTLPLVVEAQQKEVEAEALRDSFKLRMDQFKNILSAMQQDIAYLAREKQQTNYQ